MNVILMTQKRRPNHENYWRFCESRKGGADWMWMRAGCTPPGTRKEHGRNQARGRSLFRRNK